MATDLYALLDVSKDASEDEIKKAFRKKSREHHPDLGGDEEKFKEIQAAYEVLTNKQARSNYDRFGDPRGPVSSGGFGGGGDPFAGAGFGDLNDILSSLFGQSGGVGVRSNVDTNDGRDAIVDTLISLEKAFKGAEITVDVRLNRTCSYCDGTGSKDKKPPITCKTCNGAGVVQQVRDSLFGQVMTRTTCPTCHGARTQVEDPCEHCGGEGRKPEDESIKVKVPAGIATGQKLRVAGKGEAGRRGGKAGDLYVRVIVEQNKDFEREGNNLHTQLRIGMIPAALGAKTKITMLDGEEVEVEIPAGAQYGKEIIIRDKGMPRFQHPENRGTLHVHLVVETPRDLTDEDKKALKEIAKRRGEDINPSKHTQRGLFDRIKDVFQGD